MIISSSSSAGKVKDNKDVAQPLKDFGLRISKLLVSVPKSFLQWILNMLFHYVFDGGGFTYKCVIFKYIIGS